MIQENRKQEILTGEQNALVTELTETYGIEPQDIIFFQNDKKPFLTYEATCALINQLTDTHDINIEPVQNFFPDSVSLKCTLQLADGGTRSALGAVNLGETIDGEKMSEQQIYLLASSRAIRAALKTAGIDLLKLHQAKTKGVDIDFTPKSNQASLLGQAHILGQEKRLIVGNDKTLWYHELWSRYGVNHSNELSESQRADFVAFLNAYTPPMAKAA